MIIAFPVIVDYSEELFKLIGRNGLNILDIIAQDSLEDGINANFIRDLYLDADGHLNSIDTGNSTAQFSNDQYILADGLNSFNSANGETITTANYTGTDKVGLKWKPETNGILKTIVKAATTDATKCYLQSSYNGGILAEANFSTDTATFNYPIISGTSYYIMIDKDGGSYSSKRGTTLDDMPKTFDSGTYEAYIANDGGEHTDYYRDILEVNFIDTADGIMQTNEQTLDFEPTHFSIIARETTEGTGNIDYDVSFDSGVSYQTGLSSFTPYEIATSGTGLILKQNLNSGATNGISSATDWGVLIW